MIEQEYIRILKIILESLRVSKDFQEFKHKVFAEIFFLGLEDQMKSE